MLQSYGILQYVFVNLNNKILKKIVLCPRLENNRFADIIGDDAVRTDRQFVTVGLNVAGEHQAGIDAELVTTDDVGY